jgi:hypothetical protein
MRRVSVEKERVTGFQRIDIVAMTIVYLSLKHVDHFDATMLESREYIGRIRQRDEIGLNDDPAGIRPI